MLVAVEGPDETAPLAQPSSPGKKIASGERAPGKR
jgi:hypothetical protein